MFDHDIFPLSTLTFMTGNDVAELDLKCVEVGVVFDGFISAPLAGVPGLLHVHLLIQRVVLGSA